MVRKVGAWLLALSLIAVAFLAVRPKPQALPGLPLFEGVKPVLTDNTYARRPQKEVWYVFTRDHRQIRQTINDRLVGWTTNGPDATGRQIWRTRNARGHGGYVYIHPDLLPQVPPARGFRSQPGATTVVVITYRPSTLLDVVFNEWIR